MTDLKPRGDSYAVKQPGKTFCWMCGRTPNFRPKNWYAPFGIEIAHIASGGGAARRVDDRRAVICACSSCHRRHVNNSDKLPSMTIAGETLPTFDERHSLWIKSKMDPEYYDEEFLQSIWIGRLPEPEPPPIFYTENLMNLTGIFLH